MSEPSEEMVAGYNAWVASRPDSVRVIAERFKPWETYRLKPTGQLVRLYSFSEPCGEKGVTVTVNIPTDLNPMMPIGYQVFGINPDDLERLQ